jgi:regulator of protease activity HflC (stomatin/prohibitin superfamily)
MHVSEYSRGERHPANDASPLQSFLRGWRLYIVLGVLATAAIITWAGFTHAIIVEPGHHAVLIDKPQFLGSEGVRAEPLKEGRKLVWDTTTHVLVRMQPQSFSVKFDDLMTSDNTPLDFESSIQYRVTDAVKLVDRFGLDGWFTNNVEPQYRTLVRLAVKKHTMPMIMSDVPTAQTIDDEVTAGLQKLIKDSGLPIQLDGVSLGRASPNEGLMAQMNETAAQQQRKKTLVEAEAAEIQRKKEQIAKAAADNAYRNEMQLSPDQFVQLEAVKRYSDACSKAGSTCLISVGGGDTPPVVVGGRK